MVWRLLSRLFRLRRSHKAVGVAGGGEVERRDQMLILWTGAGGARAPEWSNPQNWDAGRIPSGCAEVKFNLHSLGDDTASKPVEGG